MSDQQRLGRRPFYPWDYLSKSTRTMMRPAFLWTLAADGGLAAWFLWLYLSTGIKSSQVKKLSSDSLTCWSIGDRLARAVLAVFSISDTSHRLDDIIWSGGEFWFWQMMVKEHAHPSSTCTVRRTYCGGQKSPYRIVKWPVRTDDPTDKNTYANR